MRTPLETFIAIANAGGRLGIAGDNLRTLLPAGCPPELKDAIRQHKTALIGLLRLNFLVVRSEALKTTVLWTPDEATKELLTAAGADRGSIYTASELEQLVQRRVTAAELPLIHNARQSFGGNLTEP